MKVYLGMWKYISDSHNLVIIDTSLIPIYTLLSEIGNIKDNDVSKMS
jgi:hypothetical protein